MEGTKVISKWKREEETNQKKQELKRIKKNSAGKSIKEEVLRRITEEPVERKVRNVFRGRNFIKENLEMEEIVRIITEEKLIWSRKNLVVKRKLMMKGKSEELKRVIEGGNWWIRKGKTIIIDGNTGKKFILEKGKFKVEKY